MAPTLMIFKTDGSGAAYLMEVQGKKMLPLFGDSREAAAFMTARGIDSNEYRVSDSMGDEWIEAVARDAQEQGVEHWTFGPPPDPDEPVMRLPIDHLIRRSGR
jgi:hypothetical protein